VRRQTPGAVVGEAHRTAKRWTKLRLSQLQRFGRHQSIVFAERILFVRSERSTTAPFVTFVK
jgi:hypothetical protein